LNSAIVALHASFFFPILISRKEIVEHPFGTMKRSMNQGFFLIRGLTKVNTEMSLTAIAYNMKRVFNILESKRMVQAKARTIRFVSSFSDYLHGLTAGWAE
jgi:hypothetical protein